MELNFYFMSLFCSVGEKLILPVIGKFICIRIFPGKSSFPDQVLLFHQNTVQQLGIGENRLSS
jgi:hypothetical protein